MNQSMDISLFHRNSQEQVNPEESKLKKVFAKYISFNNYYFGFSWHFPLIYLIRRRFLLIYVIQYFSSVGICKNKNKYLANPEKNEIRYFLLLWLQNFCSIICYCLVTNCLLINSCASELIFHILLLHL